VEDEHHTEHHNEHRDNHHHHPNFHKKNLGHMHKNTKLSKNPLTPMQQTFF
jgi:hypothetical protein